jgi:dienelactone hydrolase
MLSALPAVDARRLGALGYSRGGLAVSLAVSEQLSRAVLGKNLSFKAVMTGWSWCGYQFTNAATTPTAIRFALGDSDNWVAPTQCQAQALAMAQRNPNVSVRLFRGAGHGFGYDMELQEFPTAIKAYNAPVMFLNDQGTFLDLYTNQPMSGADDRAMLRVAAPWLGRGVKVGPQADQVQVFTADMVSFFSKHLAGPGV